MSGEERELEVCGHAVHRNWCAVYVIDLFYKETSSR